MPFVSVLLLNLQLSVFRNANIFLSIKRLKIILVFDRIIQDDIWIL